MIRYIIFACLIGSLSGVQLPSYLLEYYIDNVSLYSVIQQKFQTLEQQQIGIPFQTFTLSKDRTEFLPETVIMLMPEQIVLLNSLVLFFTIGYDLDPDLGKPIDLFISYKSLEILLQLTQQPVNFHPVSLPDLQDIVQAMYAADYLMIDMNIFRTLLSTLSDRSLCTLYYPFSRLERAVIDWIQQKIHATVENALYNRLECKVIAALEEHRGIVNSIAISTDNSFFVSGSRDKTIKIWHMQNEQVTYDKTLIGHTSDVTSVAISTDNAFIVSGSHDKTVKLWDRADGTLLHTFKGHRGTVAAVCISPDGKKIISSSWDKTIRIWDMESKSLLQTLSGHTGIIHSLTISPDGDTIISAATDNTIKIWDFFTGTLINTLENPMYFINSGAISTNGEYLIARSQTNGVTIWKLATSELSSPLRIEENSQTKAVAMSLNEDYIISANDNILKIWTLSNKNFLRNLNEHKKAICAVAISSDGHYIISAAEDKIMLVWRNNISVDKFCKKHVPELFTSCEFSIADTL